MKLDFREQQRWDAVYGMAFVWFAKNYDNSVDPVPEAMAHAYAVETADAAIRATRKYKGMTPEQVREAVGA